MYSVLFRVKSFVKVKINMTNVKGYMNLTCLMKPIHIKQMYSIHHYM